MYYSDDIIAEVRSRNDILDVVGSYVSMTKKGNNYWGLCPFHNEHTPSFSVNRGKQIFHCFGCSAGGNVISFIMKYENLTFQEAVKVLADRAGIQLPEREATQEEKQRQSRRARLLEVNKEAATYFYRCLRSPHGERGMKYLSDRGLSPETMKNFGLGYAGVNGREVIDYLRSKGFTDEEIRNSGLASISEKNGLSSPFWNRVMFPIMDANHRVIGFGGRVMGDAKPKYLNSPETDIFDKRRNLYGFVFARSSRAGNYILCEGYMDVIAMHQAGFTQAVASLGTAFTEEQAKLLSRYTQKVLLAYDSDGAGVKAALRAIDILKDVGLSGRVISLKPCKDPDEFIKTYGKEAFQERIDNAENSFYFRIRIIYEGYDQNDPEQKTAFYRDIATKLCEEFREPLERENYLTAICEKYKINTGQMRDMVADYAAKGAGIEIKPAPQQARARKVSETDGARTAQAMLITWLTDETGLLPAVKRFVTPEDFTDELYRKVAENVFAAIESGSFDAAGMIDRFDEEERDAVAGLLQAKLPEMETQEERNRAFSDIILRIRENSYKIFCDNMGDDMSKFGESLQMKKELEKLKKTGITLR